MKRVKPFNTEAELCEAFCVWARSDGMLVYAETAGWDIVLVHPTEHWQLGVEAKLSLNTRVLQQALKGLVVGEYMKEQPGPDFRAVLVPEREQVMSHLAAVLGVEVFTPRETYDARGPKWAFHAGDWYADAVPWFDHNPLKRLPLPDFIPDVVAGVPSPRTLSPWKVGALRVLAMLELQGFVTRDDVRKCGNDPRRWCASDGWLSQRGDGRWVRASRTPKFDQEHTEVYPQVLQEAREKLTLTMQGRAA